MTREQVAKMIHWPKIIWLVGIVNPMFMLPQLYKIWVVESALSISLLTMTVLFCIQSGFATHGFFLRDRPLCVSNVMAATVTMVTGVSALYFGASW